MKRRRSFRRPDPATQEGIAKALRESFDQIEREADAEMQRLIDQMKDFEGNSGNHQ